MADSLQQQKARERWKILASVIKKKALDKEGSKISVRRFSGFNLFSKKLYQNEGDYEWLECRLGDEIMEDSSVHKPLLIKQRSRQVILEDLTGFDNTGNVCLWPSEEVLTYYLLKHKDRLIMNEKSVCELGAGMTGLTGIFLASFADPSMVLLTDGNKDCVENMEAIIHRNKPLFGSTIVRSQCLIWDEQANLSDLESKFDFIISADSLFFTQCHSGLLHVMDTLLKDSGLAILMAPRRKNTLELFCSKACSRFSVVMYENYDSLMWSRHQLAKDNDPLYNEDIHYPVLMILSKNKEMTFCHTCNTVPHFRNCEKTKYA